MEPRGALVLTALRPDPKDPTALAFVGVDGRVMLAKAPGAAEAQRWLEALAAFVPALAPAEPAAATAPDASAPAAPPRPGLKSPAVSPVADYESVLYTPKAQAVAATEAAMEAAPTGAVEEPEESAVAELSPSFPEPPPHKAMAVAEYPPLLLPLPAAEEGAAVAK